MGLDNPIHIAVLLIILLLVFGAKRLPEMGRSLGSGMRGFKDSLTGITQSSEVPHQTQDTPAESTAVLPAPETGTPAAWRPAGAPENQRS